jgi:hypothetical protein
MSAGLFDALRAVAAHQAVESLDGAHPRPRQRVVKDALGADPNGGPVRGARCDKGR